MIDITELLNAERNEFISVREFVERIHIAQPKAIKRNIAKILLRTLKSDKYSSIEIVMWEDGIEPLPPDIDSICWRNNILESLRVDGLGIRGPNDYDFYGFRRSDPELKKLAETLGADLSTPLDRVDSKFWSDERNVDELQAEIALLKARIEELESERPIHLYKYWDKDPLAKAIEIRNREWANYDPNNDRATRGNQGAITTELEERGFTSRQAASIELVACPIKR